MADHEQGTIDILEIYHARRVRAELIGNLRRLRVPNPLDPHRDPIRLRELRTYYEAMFFTVEELLQGLGDDSPPA